MNAVQHANERLNIKLQNRKENSARNVTKLQASSSIDQPFALSLSAENYNFLSTKKDTSLFFDPVQIGLHLDKILAANTWRREPVSISSQ